MEWISKIIVYDDKLAFSNTDLIDKLKNYFKNNTYPLLIAELEEDENCFKEISRGFIVHDTWPKTEL